MDCLQGQTSRTLLEARGELSLSKASKQLSAQEISKSKKGTKAQYVILNFPLERHQEANVAGVTCDTRTRHLKDGRRVFEGI